MTNHIEEKAQDGADVSFKWLIRTGAAVLSLWIASGLIIYNCFPETERGIVGDMFGAVNALFSGLAFAVLIYTMQLQRDELKLQREELKSTREELAGQKEQMELQNNTMRRQRFETTFFNLLDLFAESVKALEYPNGTIRGDTITGRACFQIILSDLGFISNLPGSSEITASDIQELIHSNADDLIETNDGMLSQFISILEQIVIFIDSSQLSNEEKDGYAAILQSMLSQDEKVLLLHLGLSTYGEVKLKPYIERYALLTKLHPNREGVPKVALGYYKPYAFGAGTPQSI